MGTRINTNTGAILATLNLNRNFGSAQRSIEKLSSGLRIVRASDDVAGLVTSQSLFSQAGGFAQSARNASESINFVQVADSSVANIVDTLNKIRSLALQGGNGILDSAARSGLSSEFTQLKSEMQRVLNTTKYGDFFLLKTTNSSGGTAGTGSINSNFSLKGVRFALGPSGEVSSAFVFQYGISSVETALRAGGTSGAAPLSFGNMSSVSAAKSVLTSVDSAVRSIGFFRGTLGAMQDMLGQAQKTDENTNANLTAAVSLIRDVDFASEVANFTSKSILSQAGMAFLAQANLLQQSVLTLLG